MCAMAQPPWHLDSVLSFSHDPDGTRYPDPIAPYDASNSDDAGFEFAFAPPLMAAGNDAEDDLFEHRRIIPAYPVFDRHLLHELTEPQAPSPDTYCAWAPGSPAREGPFPKSASTGEARRFWRPRDLVVGAGGRSHSDGKEKFVFLQPAAATPSKMSGKAIMAAETVEGKQATKPSAPQQRQQKPSKKKSKAGAMTEMNMATAHKLFYGKQLVAGAGADRKQHSYLPYRPGIVGFFATAHALGRSHHPY
ncbi:uncharacterized protein LOC133918318 [Phragmites australis]|uniref:uncharacterized protein LOC133918318 n=1 Tax=Phragmites australis TaxID=29695 RepID=UPI002D777A41|nr:uncharacterized protein LOC133918318 [Phragmites australis]